MIEMLRLRKLNLMLEIKSAPKGLGSGDFEINSEGKELALRELPSEDTYQVSFQVVRSPQSLGELLISSFIKAVSAHEYGSLLRRMITSAKIPADVGV